MLNSNLRVRPGVTSILKTYISQRLRDDRRPVGDTDNGVLRTGSDPDLESYHEDWER